MDLHLEQVMTFIYRTNLIKLIAALISTILIPILIIKLVKQLHLRSVQVVKMEALKQKNGKHGKYSFRNDFNSL
jgi:hypothetical protein